MNGMRVPKAVLPADSKDFDPVMQELHPPKRDGFTPVWKEKS
jgi:hypothetical protein